MTVSLTDDPDALLTAREVATFRRTTENALCQERWRGSGPRYVKVGSRVLYRARDLAEFLDTHTVIPQRTAPQRD